MLKPGGRGAFIVRNSFLSHSDDASVRLRKLLLQTCNLHTVLVCPSGTFLHGDGRAAVLFFHKGESTQKTWFYRLAPAREISQASPLEHADFAEFLELQQTCQNSASSWILGAAAINPRTFDLSPRRSEEIGALEYRSPKDIMDEIAALDAENAKVLSHILQLL